MKTLATATLPPTWQNCKPTERITVELPKRRGRGSYYKGSRYLLVQGFRRKIRICCNYQTFFDDLATPQFLEYLTNLADKRGWKTLVLQRDGLYRETLTAANPFQSWNNHPCGGSGIYVCSPESWEYNAW